MQCQARRERAIASAREAEWLEVCKSRGREERQSTYNKNWWSSYGVYKDDKDDKDTKLVQSDHWYDDEEYFETEILFDALYDAQAGYYDDIINLIAECVYPEDPVFAIKFLSKRKLTDDLLEEAKQMARSYDAPTVLCTLFDAIHCEA
jgi:hypothetical protein